MEDSVFLTRSLGTSCEGLRDQYADGKAARVWETFIGSIDSRTQNYNKFLIGLLQEKGCKRILDVACGTGVDSVMLLEDGFEVISTDASDKMLKYAYKKRWDRRKEKAFDNWGAPILTMKKCGKLWKWPEKVDKVDYEWKDVLCHIVKLLKMIIKEANWLTLSDDVREYIDEGFDAVICLGNSFAHLIDTSENQLQQKRALEHFKHCVRPGGLLVIDHRNFDYILDKGFAPAHCIYYNSPYDTKIQTSVLYVAGKPTMVIMDYFIDIKNQLNENLKGNSHIKNIQNADLDNGNEFRLSYFPHKLNEFTKLLDSVFPKNTKHTIYGDFKALNAIETPGFYIHVLEKQK